MPDPLAVRVMRQFREDLLSREAETMRQMARRWREVERGLEARVNALAEQLAGMIARGEVISESRLLNTERYRALLAQARAEIARYNRFADSTITGLQEDYADRGIESAFLSIRAVYTENKARPRGLDRLPVEALETQAGFLANGAPLSDLLRESFSSAADGITQELLLGIAAGDNPRVMARRINKGLSVGLNRIMRIARTEPLRSYREASRQQYQASGVVSGYKRISARDSRVCPACLFSDGKLYALDKSLDEHPQGRCALVPIVRGFRAPQWESGRDWFLKQSTATQSDILGPLFDSWRGGAFDLQDVVGVRRNRVWGDSLRVKSLKELTQ